MLTTRLLRRLQTFMRESPPTRSANAADVAVQYVSRTSRNPFPALLVLAGLSALFWPTAVRAGTVSLDTIGGYPNPVGGGPFKATVQSAFGGYARGSTFDTFCVEFTEEFYPNVTYQAQISTQAVFGHDSDGTIGYDALTSKTAWLYSTWRAGVLGNYVAGWNADDNPDQLTGKDPGDLYALQDVIWQTQNWVLPPTTGANLGLETNLLKAATDNANGSLYNVRIMQMWDSGYVGDPLHAHQDQLILVPSPTAALGGLLLLTGIAVYQHARWRRTERSLT